MSVDLSRYVRDVADFPKPGVVFKDLTPLLADAHAFAASIDALVAPFADMGIERVVGIEARGFIFGAAAAHALRAGFVPMRKPRKLRRRRSASITRSNTARTGSRCMPMRSCATSACWS
jgi:adenine phosphoribosyltransferase